MNRGNDHVVQLAVPVLADLYDASYWDVHTSGTRVSERGAVFSDLEGWEEVKRSLA